MEHRAFMEAALALAVEAANAGEVPVGAVIVKNGQIIGSGRNRREHTKSALAHAEMEAIHAACQTLGDWRLTGCTLYVTLEPCAMCCGALRGARIDSIVFGAYDPAAGACVSQGSLVTLPEGQRPQIIGGYMEAQCKALLTAMFAAKRSES